MNLRSLVKAWVRAEYQFRFGRDNYGAYSANDLIRTEGMLRKKITGESDLVEAAKVLGVYKRRDFVREVVSKLTKPKKKKIRRNRLVEDGESKSVRKQRRKRLASKSKRKSSRGFF